MGSVQNIKIEPMNATWGENVAQVQKITCVASTSLNSQYFVFYDVDGTKRYAWFDVNSTGVDPAVPSGTGAEVDLADANQTAAQVATALAAVLEALAGYTASADGAVVTLTHVANGAAKPAHDGAADTGFSFEVEVYGDIAADIGYVDGSIELALEDQNVDVTTHQTGSEILSHINTGKNVTLTLNFKETSASNLRKLLSEQGGTALPAGTGVGATQAFGWGSDRRFKQTIGRAKKLVLHPAVLPASNYSRDFCFWNAYAMLESLSFSGEEILTVPCSFMVYEDSAKPAAINKFMYGDHTQFA